MSELIHIHTISQIHQFLRLNKPKHPLVSIIRGYDPFTQIDIESYRYSLDLYIVNLKANMSGTCTYGRNTYDHQEGTIVFMAPGQTVKYEAGEELPDYSKSWILLFHPDLIRKSELGKKIGSYSFFNYESHEALHVSEDEKQSLHEIIIKIEKEYSQNLDKHSQELIVSNIKLLLDYCTRYFDRQFYTRANLNKDIVSKFELMLKQYYQSDRPAEMGIPSVVYLGKEMGMSPYYLSDLLKKETGRNTIEHIHFFIIDKAKTLLLSSSKSVSEIAYDLGFGYPQHFATVFKNKTGNSPSEYRNLN